MSKLKLVFNPFTGELDYVSKTLTRQQVISSILLDKDEQSLPGQAQIQILFDEDTILYNDDEAL
jgi:acid phosphatase class B